MQNVCDCHYHACLNMKQKKTPSTGQVTACLFNSSEIKAPCEMHVWCKVLRQNMSRLQPFHCTDLIHKFDMPFMRNFIGNV